MPGLRLVPGLVAAGLLLAGLAMPAPDARAAGMASPAIDTAAAAQPGAPVVVVGVAGLRWTDLSPIATPNLWDRAATSATGTMVVRTVRPWTCPIDGWLTVSAGRRAAAPLPGDGSGPSCVRPPAPVPTGAGRGATVPGFAELLTFNGTGRFEARLGLLEGSLDAAGVCATAVGPGAALALASADGVVSRYLPVPPARSDAYADCPLTIVDLGAVVEPQGREEDGAWNGAPTTPRADQVAALDRRLGDLLATVPDATTVLVAALSDSERFPHLSVAMAWGRAPRDGDYGSAWLNSRSTRRQALVQLTDLTPTVLALLGVDQPGDAVGSPWTAGADHPDDTAVMVAQLVDMDSAAQVVRYVVPPFYALLVIAQVVLYGSAAVALRRQWGGPGRRLRVLRLTRRTAVVCAAVPVSTFLANIVPWWRMPSPTVALIGCLAATITLVTLVALLGPWRRWLLGPPGAVAALTGIVLGADVVTGSYLQMSSLMGYSPLVGGRFYGFGNVAFALFATGTLLAVTAFAEPLVDRGRTRAAVALAATTGVVAVLIDGLPRWGSDFGGVLALVPGFAVLVLKLAGLRLSVRRFAAILVGAVATIATIAIVDWTRPMTERAHLGRFVQQVLDGEALPIVVRKLQANAEILQTNYSFSLLVPVAFAFVVLVLLRPLAWRAAALKLAYDRAPTLRPGLVALGVLLGVGFAVNDSGIAIPAVGLTLAIPFLLAVSVTALERDEAEGADGRAVGAPPTTPAEPSRPGATRA